MRRFATETGDGRRYGLDWGSVSLNRLRGSIPIEAAMLRMYALRILEDVFCKHKNITEKQAFVDFSKHCIVFNIRLA